jgi:tyrosyl-tRNA synthetase
MLEDILIQIKAAQSKREAREFIKNNAVSVNGKKVNDNTKTFDKSELLFGEYLIIKRGKKNYYLVEM